MKATITWELEADEIDETTLSELAAALAIATSKSTISTQDIMDTKIRVKITEERPLGEKKIEYLLFPSHYLESNRDH